MLRNGLEPWHLLVLGIVVIMLFGSKKLPDSARALGQSLRILKSETKAMKEDGAAPGGAAPGAAPGTASSERPAAAAERPVAPEGGARAR
ncbi:Sec-independent protein translocase subunit TatA [Streptomyces sp. NBC_01012]|uniref:Sec-independent protein translocase subunit TatA n=1 Tax=Streptomyces sp. NBC_01012 TaxID=2903717 RepID=UPI00386418E6|nr:Sec-independent protein translocase subunit TatA [Streptomyces sp. NBC_01012]